MKKLNALNINLEISDKFSLKLYALYIQKFYKLSMGKYDMNQKTKGDKICV